MEVRLPAAWMMTYLCLINLLIYVDRGCISAVLSKLSSEDEMGLSGTEAGVLGSAFMFGFVFSSPLFAHYAFAVYPMVLMALGLFLWSLATAAAGLAANYWILLTARACTGIGEASFVCLAPPYIFEIAPPSRKTLWIAMFYTTIILGFAGGSVYGEEVMSTFGSWRAPFLIESLAMLPFIMLAAFFEKDPRLLPQEEGREHPSLTAQLRTLAHNRVFVFVVLGSAVITFTIGGLGFWGNSILETLFDVSTQTASLTFGSLTLGCGLLAALIGSLLMDYMLLRFEQAFAEGSITEAEFERTRTRVACLFAICSTTGAAAFGIGCVFVRRFWLFIGLIGGAEFMAFLSVGPIGVAIMSCVQKYLRGQANAVCVFFMHMLGDMPSPFVIGVMKDAVGLEWGIFVLSIWMLLGAVAWFFGYHYGGSLAKRQLEDPEAKKLIAGQ